MLTLSNIGHFTWGFNRFFHISTEIGDFEWSDPAHGGDNVIRPAPPYGDWLDIRKIPYGRDKGTHVIGQYCGPDAIIECG